MNFFSHTDLPFPFLDEKICIMVNAVDAGDADQVTGKSMCAKMLIKTVGRRDISGPEASFELSGLALWRRSRPFTYLSMSGSRRLDHYQQLWTRPHVKTKTNLKI